MPLIVLLLAVGVALLLRTRPTPLPVSFARVPLLGRFTPLPVSAGHVGPLVWRASTVTRSPHRGRQLLAVARVEAREVVRHPLVVLATLLLLVGLVGVAALDATPHASENFEALTGGSPALFYLGLLGYFGAFLVASRDRRSDTTEQLEALSVSTQLRTGGTLLAAAVLGLLALVLSLALWLIIEVRDLPMPATPTISQVLIVPACCIGAGVLGVMVARWAPVWPAALVIIVGITFVTAGAGELGIDFWVPYVNTTDWDTGVLLPEQANWTWHLLYIVGLDVMACIGALLRGRLTDVRLLAAGAAAVIGTAVAGVAQLP